MSFQDAFAGSNAIAPREEGSPLGDGSYPEITIGEVKVIKGYHGTRFIAALHVTAEPSGDAPTAEGGEGNFSSRIDGPNASIGLGDVKAFVLKALGVSKDDQTFDFEKTIPKVFGPEQILRGRKLSVSKWTKTTKAGHKMPAHKFDPIEGQASPAPASPPPLPGLPPAVPPPPLPAAFPPPGWTAHPQAPGYFYKGIEVLTEAALRARGA